VLLVALASWGFIAYLLVILFAGIVLPAHDIVLAKNTRKVFLLEAVLICVALWVLALTVAWGVRCPKCGRQLLPIFTRKPLDAPSLSEGLDQFFPWRVLRRRRMTCRNCGTVSNFSGDAGV
jgi:hypothetical protein